MVYNPELRKYLMVRVLWNRNTSRASLGSFWNCDGFRPKSVNIYQITRCHIGCPVVNMCEDGDLSWVSATCISGRVLLHWSDRLLLRVYHVLEVIRTHAMTDEWVIN
jgi:hypothetical protein